MPDKKGEGSYKGTKKLNTGEQWGRPTFWVFGDEGCPGAVGETEDSRGMSAGKVCCVAKVSGVVDNE